jgi:DNA polymerase (family 10)
VDRRNVDLAAAFERLALFLELDGADKFRTRAYRRAARSIAAATFDVADSVRCEDGPAPPPGVGPRLGALVCEYAATGRIRRLQQLEEKYPAGLLDLLRLPRLGARRVRLLHDRLGIRSLEDLRRAAEAGTLATVKGIGPRVQEEVRHGLERFGPEIPYRRADVVRILPELLDRVRAYPAVREVHLAGSLRRRREVVSEVDLVLVVDDPASFHERVRDAAIVSRDRDRVAMRLPSGLRVNLFPVDPSEAGSALVLRTGSPRHVDQLKSIPTARDERQIYDRLGLPFIEPELREGAGEIEAAARGALPALLRLEDLRGDLHAHTDATDGRDTLERMAEAAAERGLRYLAVTDHTRSLKITNGQDERRLAAQMAAIERLNGRMGGLTLLKSAEVDILEDGRLDLSDDILKDLDLTVCSVHSRFTLPPQVQTERVLRAMEHPSFRILGHPTGRLLLRRRGHPLDVDRLIRAAKELGRILELNSQPDRLDLDDEACRRAREAGVQVSISSDAHGVREFDYLQWGIDQARRGWLEPKDVVNTMGLPELRRRLAGR